MSSWNGQTDMIADYQLCQACGGTGTNSRPKKSIFYSLAERLSLAKASKEQEEKYQQVKTEIKDEASS